ncbi:zinc finger HIT domain-containing protein 2 [Zerene cesonia]|uniref:zinc finger HIT domain-containing protein 2 n=1 Tax=Zerene cesonia TaxID=33412 RepID=UPI0018E4EF41|nr:zinc finger HIT domain-containing protein 2 [Zerene cesonia]
MSEETNHNTDNRLCGLCEQNNSKYSCPRCDVLYCSLNCYKAEKHLQCSESFYKDCVNQELALHEADDESKSQMIDILKRIQNQDLDGTDNEDDNESIDSDDEVQIDLHDRLQNLNLNDADSVWSALTEDEKNEFEALLSQGNVGAIVPHWEPWWMYRRDKKLVEDLKQTDNEKEILKKCPHIKSVPLFSTLTNVKPSPSIRFNIINVLAAYAFIMRYYNGEVEPIEATTCVLSICDNLNSNSNYDDPDIAVEAVTQKCLLSDLIETDEDSLEIMRHDTFLLFQGPNDDNVLLYTKAALSHLIQIFSESKTLSKLKPEEKQNKGDFTRKFPDHGKNHLPSLDISKVKKCIKKMEFYISFLNTCK